MSIPTPFSRSDKLLKSEFLHYFLPAMLTAAALSLSEFADSMIVANLLDSRAFAIVQLGSPVILISAAVYILLGAGGSILYAICLGQRDKDKAGRLLGTAVTASIVTGLLLTVLAFVFFNSFASLLCTEEELYEGFSSYLRVLLISMPFIIAVLAFVSFLPPAGAPGLATAVNVIANVVNIGMDFVYIKLFGMGPEGAAWATVTGYGVGAVVIVIFLLTKKVKVRISLPRPKDLPLLKDIAVAGAPFAMTQLGYAIKLAVSGRLAQLYGGTAGIEAFSLAIQVLSIVGSILMAATVEAATPIMALLHGQRDHEGERLVFKNMLIMELVISAVGALFFFIFAKQSAMIYNIKDPESLALSVRCLRIFVFSIVTRGFFVSMQKQAQVVGDKLYPLVVSLFDGLVGIIPLCYAFTAIWGIDGLFIAYTVTGVLTVLICIVWNIIKAKKSNGRFTSFLLSERELGAKVLMDVTVRSSSEDISGLSETIQEKCLELGMSSKDAYRAALLVEEMGVYLKGRLSDRGYMDILVRDCGDRLEIDYRTIGADGDPNADDERTELENIGILRGIASEIKYDFVMGMNCTEIVLKNAAQPSE